MNLEDYDCSIGEIWSRRQIRDTVQNRRPLYLEQHFIGIRVKLTCREAATCRKTAESIGEP